MSWLKVAIMTTVICAVMLVAALILLSVAQKGVEPMSLLTIVLVGFPLSLAAAAPVCIVILPAADAILERRDKRLFRDMTIIGAIAGALVPLFVVFVLKFRPAGMVGTVTALLVLAGLVMGGAAGLFYAEMLARLHKS
jgi:hypothetical protein